MMKKIGMVILVFVSLQIEMLAQSRHANPNYIPVKSSSVFQDKSYYLLSLFEKINDVSSVLLIDEKLSSIAIKRRAALTNTPIVCKDTLTCYANLFLWSEEENQIILNSLQKLYQQKSSVKRLVQEHVRPSGYFENDINLSDEKLLLKAWKDAADGMNNIINVYLLNKIDKYAASDSVSYSIKETYYKNVIKEMFFQTENIKTANLFFNSTFQVCKQLLEINNRDEAIRFEPLSSINNKAFSKIEKINFNDFPFSLILTLGEGPENNFSISPNNKYRCKTAAENFRKKMAPFIMVSGGNVHPFQTSFNEGIEMKKYLMEHLGVPEHAIIVEPYARHTITNFRNANRIIFRNNIPFNKKVLCVTSKYHTDYLNKPEFEKRSIQELGYAPFKSIRNIGIFTSEFFPTIESLQINVLDPLDP